MGEAAGAGSTSRNDTAERSIVALAIVGVAITLVLRILAARGQPGIMHSFSGDWAYASACLDVGFMLSFSGPVTFTKALDLHDVARRAPLDYLLTETDSPYLAPHPLRGTRNEPANVRLVAERLAALRAIPMEDLAQAVWANAANIFSLANTGEH